LKEGVEPTEEEKKILLNYGIKAYSYELIEPALRAAANGMTVEAVAYFPKLPKGFSFEAQACGIKKSNKLDFGLIESSSPCIWAGTFTQNKARAFCVEENLTSYDSKVKVVACNSGNANACTGEAGAKADRAVRKAIAEAKSIEAKEVLFASTGGIGIVLPSEKITNVIASDKAVIAKQTKQIKSFAQAILTTDLCIKISQDSKQNFLGVAKGSGMIHPNMATMLAFIITDKKIKGLNEAQTKAFMQECLSEAVDKSFNSITVDGDTSTNDSCFLLNNLEGEEISKEEFKASLEELTKDLAYKIACDGEGITKLTRLKLKSDFEDVDARKLGRFILNSSLVKTAIFGNDPNWGRIVSSCGQYCAENDLDLNLTKVNLKILDTKIFENGLPAGFDREALIAKMKKSFEIPIDLDLGGNRELELLGNDLSYGYVEINAEYFS